MHFKKREQSEKVKKRILRHKRVRYHNDAAFFGDQSYSAPRKRTKALRKKHSLQLEDKNEAHSDRRHDRAVIADNPESVKKMY